MIFGIFVYYNIKLYIKMVKFGKKYRQRKIKDWDSEYIDYKSLKHFIRTQSQPGN